MALPYSPNKRLGQHFLHDPNIIRKISDVLKAPAGAPVVEIGPGTGALTEALLKTHPSLVAVEVDDRAVQYLRRQFPALDVRHQDVLDVEWAVLASERGAPLYVIGNLPYQITSPLLFDLLGARVHLREAVLMMQKEVAERLVATPRTKQYGILSVLVQLYAAPEKCFDVSRHVFYPKPRVESAVVRLMFDRQLEADFDAVRQVVRAAFNQRRKMLRNSLSRWTREHGIALPHGWGTKRAEALAPGEFVTLTQFLAERVEALHKT